jgi:outer membrane receptor protein involved in Fe transport
MVHNRTNFTNSLDAIPAAAIERIEIRKMASAIYGSDAIAAD